MFGGMKERLVEMQQKVEETKARLENVTVDAKNKDGSVTVVVNGNRKLVEILLEDEALSMSVDEITKVILSLSNKALEKAEKLSESEMQGIAKGILPGFPG